MCFHQALKMIVMQRVHSAELEKTPVVGEKMNWKKALKELSDDLWAV